MIKRTLMAVAIAAASASAYADESGSEEKKFSVGIASFATVVRYDTYFGGTQSEDFSGFAIFGTGAVNNNVAFRLTYAKQKYDDDSSLKLDALEGSLLAGTGLLTTGFKAYGSLGFFSEDLKVAGIPGSVDFSGLMLGGGIGYNWESVSLEFWVNFRDPSDYEDLFGVDAVAASGGLGLSARF